MLFRLVSILLFVVVGGQYAIALEETQCSNSDGTLQRAEQEVWGANIIDWIIMDKRFGQGSLTIDWSDRTYLEKEEGPHGGKSKYAVVVSLSSDSRPLFIADDGTPIYVMKDMLLCSSWWNDAID